MPAGSRYAARARHALGLARLEDGRGAEGAADLESVLASDSTYGARREVWLALAGHALDEGRWAHARALYERADQDWDANRQSLQWELASGNFEARWKAWESGDPLSDALALDGVSAALFANALADASTDLSAPPAFELPAPASAPWGATMTWTVDAPNGEERRRIEATADAEREAEGALQRARWDLAREREALSSLTRYLTGGLGLARQEAADLEAKSALLDSLRRTLDDLDRRLRDVRDEATRHVLERTAAQLVACERHLLWLAAMKHFHLEGPNRVRAVPAPLGYEPADSVVAVEEALARDLVGFATRMAADAPGLLARSYDTAWRPGLVDRAAREAEDARRALAWARTLGVRIDSNLAASHTSDEERRLVAAIGGLERRVDTLIVAHARQRERAARAALERALAGLTAEREGLDYGLAASAYGLAVKLDRPGGPADGDTVRTQQQADEAFDDPESARWRAVAIEALQSFLAKHPKSGARGESRFRLADLELVAARQEFRKAMEAYLAAQAAGREPGPLPVLTHADALALYRKILAEDRDFEHLDAVRFNAGMILADEANPEAEAFFTDLVTLHPESPYVQEATLRLGDLRFNEKRFDEGVAFYTHAAAGKDAGLSAIALYKKGWARFNQDRFLEAADAFRAVLDLYDSPRRAEIAADVEGEAESYLVHSLAGAGGADAFASYFDSLGARPYERRVLLALGQHFRRYGLYADATDADRRFLARYPLDAQALTTAERLIETHQRANHDERAREARLDVAAHFAPGSAWAEAQASDSLRAAGEAFALGAWSAVAKDYHRLAREKGAKSDWKQALELYETLLAKFPNRPEAPTLELSAGEASAQLEDWPGALAHYAAAAKSGDDSLAVQALWQRVAVTDAWYRGTTPKGAQALGRDSLAREVIAAGDALLERFPSHAQGADIVWREGQLGFAHGWWERAAQDMERLAKRWPDDKRAPLALGLRADAVFRSGDFAAAGTAYEEALVVAQRAGNDTLAKRLATAVPICAYKNAEASVAADSNAYARHAELFEQVARRFPNYEHAHVAAYRAGLAYFKAGRTRDGVLAMEALIRDFPKSDYVRDAHLEIAHRWEEAGEKEQGADAYARFATRYPKDADADDAWLKAADLWQAAGLSTRADEQRLAYLKQYPKDDSTAIEILEGFAMRDLDRVTADRPISTVMPKPAAKGAKAAAAAAPASYLADYLRRAAAHPELASKKIVARVRFLEGEEAFAKYDAVKLTLPLAKSIAARQKKLDETMALYRKSVDTGVPEWAHASAYRIGQSLIAFGEALERSERPADLHGDDLKAYVQVLGDKAQQFYDRGETVWTEALKKSRDDAPDDWLARAQTSLWSRLGNRFFYRPEMEYPVVAGKAPKTSAGGLGALDEDAAGDRARTQLRKEQP